MPATNITQILNWSEAINPQLAARLNTCGVSAYTERATSDKLANLVRIAAEGTRTVAHSTARGDRAPTRPTLLSPLSASEPRLRLSASRQATAAACSSWSRLRPYVVACACLRACART